MAEYIGYLKDYAIDGMLAAVFLVTVIVYYKKSFIRAILEFAAFFGAALAAKFFSERVGSFLMEKTDFFSDPHGKEKANLVAIVILFILISVTLEVIIHYIDKGFTLPVIKTANKMLGIALGILIGFVVVGGLAALFKLLELSGIQTVIDIVENSRIIKLYCKLLAKIYPYISELIKKGV